MTSSRAGHIRVRSNYGVSELSQFMLVLYVLFLIMLLPLLDLVTVLIAAATVYLASNDIVAKAATQPDYANCLKVLVSEANQFQSTGFAKLFNMSPRGGYTGSGNDLYVLSTNIGSGAVTKSQANQPLAVSVNTTTNMYELSVRSQYSVSPLVSLAAVPFLGNVPGLSAPATLVFSATRPVEHPGDLQAQANNSNSNGVVQVFPRVPSDPVVATATPVTWRDPNIFKEIKAAGETVVQENVLIVQADNPNPTTTGCTVLSGQQCWIDTQAVGNWKTVIPPDCGSSRKTPVTSNANGLTSTGQYNGFFVGALLGQLGGGANFQVGIQQLNLAPPGAGALTLLCNDAASVYNQNSGYVTVRVIITQ